MKPPNIRPLLPAFLSQQRWFAGKGREFRVTDVTWLQIDPTPPAELWLALVTVRYLDGSSETYQLPLGVRLLVNLPDHFLAGDEPAQLGVVERGADHVLVFDALHDGDLAARVFQVIAAGGEHGDVTTTSDIEATDASPRLISAEQSNTSIVYGESYVVKFYRRLGQGTNPEVDVLRALTGVGCSVIAPLLGSVEGASRTLAVLQPFFASATEAWALALTSVRSVLAPGAGPVDEDGADFASDSSRLGSVTAQIHADLAAALPTRLADVDETRATTAQLHERLSMALAVVPELEPFRDAIRAAYDELSRIQVPVPVQRIHGDYHLGQVLRVDTGWVVLDFEGEPTRPIEDRVALMSPLRDIAGMLRSLDYASRHLLADQPESQTAQATADAWAARNREAFCAGYAETSGVDPREHAVLLRCFELDKAVYEAAYETRYRPTWLDIPLSGIARLVARD